MLRVFLFSSLVLFLAGGASAFITFNNNDNDNMKFSNEFMGVTKVKCFGAVLSENNDEDHETEFDICLFGVVGGLIVLIGLYPALISQGAPAQFLRRQDNQYLAHQQQPQFVNPHASVQQRQGKPSVSQRFTNFFNSYVQKFKTSTQKLTDSALERFGHAESDLESTLYDIQQKVQPQE